MSFGIGSMYDRRNEQKGRQMGSFPSKTKINADGAAR